MTPLHTIDVILTKVSKKKNNFFPWDGIAWNDLSNTERRYFTCEYEDLPVVGIVVSPDGDDVNGNGSEDNPYATIQYAINVSDRNDTIYVLAGTYEENITLLSDLKVYGSGADNTTITASSGNVVTANNVHDVTLSGFTIDGQGTADNGILCSGSTSDMEIKKNTITNSKWGIQLADSANTIIYENTIYRPCADSRKSIYC